MSSLHTSDEADLWARCLKEREADAQRIRTLCKINVGEPLSPRLLEQHFPVACVAVPNLCIGVACRWVLQGAGEIPPCLQCLVDADSLEAGRPLRGACLAFRGKALLLADEKDDAAEQSFSFLHEASHFFLHHLFPRENAVRRMGLSITAVLDGNRTLQQGERFDVVVRRADLAFHTHLYRRDAPGRPSAETEADVLACLLLAPCLFGVPSADAVPTPATLIKTFFLPATVAETYAAGARRMLEDTTPARHPLLRRLGL